MHAVHYIFIIARLRIARYKVNEKAPDTINARRTKAGLALESLVKWVRLSDEVHKELTEVTSKSETYSESIHRLIKFYRERHKENDQ